MTPPQGVRVKPDQPEYDDAGEIRSAVDWLGNRFNVGDLVLYCITAHPGGRMAYGTVVRIEPVVIRPGWTELRVQVRTIATSDSYDRTSGGRSRPAWVTAANITAAPGMVWPS